MRLSYSKETNGGKRRGATGKEESKERERERVQQLVLEHALNAKLKRRAF